MATNGEDMDLGNWGQLASGLAGMYGNLQGYNNASGLNSQIQSGYGQNVGASSASIQALQQQLAQQRAQSQAAYDSAQGNVNTQNQGLEGNIGTMTSNLNALSDPNSPYMQMARQAIERKDAASGRRSQWGERETQLAGTLADYVGKYSPGINSSITQARNQINQNNLGLANIFSNMNNTNTQGQNSLAQMLQQQQAGLGGMNTTARGAANSSTNNLTGLINSGIKGLGGLAGLFGGSSGSNGLGIMGDMFGTGTGNSFGDGSLWGNSFQPMSDYGSSTSGLGGYGYGNLPAGDYFGGGGIGGVPTSWDGGGTGSNLFDSSLWD